jgi:hypothetical protein
MFVAERELQPDELTRTFERYSKLTREAARKIVDFHERRVRVREADAHSGAIAMSESAPVI